VKGRLKRFFVSGTNHRCAPLELREKIAFSRHGLARALQKLRETDFLEESLILSTCNRVEIYGVARESGGAAQRQVLEFLRQFHGMESRQLSEHLYFLEGEDAVRHLFRVASGLDSMVIGENEILGQAKEAFRQASNCGTLASFLRPIFERAFKTAKEVKHKTKISEGALSVSSVAVEQARKILGGFQDKNILILGTGEAGELSLKKWADGQTGGAWITGRHADRAAVLARKYGAGVVSFGDWEKYLSRADAIFSSATAPKPLIRSADIRSAMRRRKNRPLFIADLAVPRSADLRVKKIKNVFLCDLEDFQKVCENNLFCRSGEMVRALEIVGGQVRGFVRWVHRREFAPFMRKISEDCDRIIDGELRKAVCRKSPEEFDSLRRILKRVKSKILLERIACFENAEGFGEKPCFPQDARLSLLDPEKVFPK